MNNIIILKNTVEKEQIIYDIHLFLLSIKQKIRFKKCITLYINMNKIYYDDGENYMLAAEGLLKVLSAEIDKKDYENYNNDHDFSEVLKYCGDHTDQVHTIRYADGKEKKFSFDK